MFNVFFNIRHHVLYPLKKSELKIQFVHEERKKKRDINWGYIGPIDIVRGSKLSLVLLRGLIGKSGLVREVKWTFT